MELKNRSFPYPVLSRENDNYKQSEFVTEVDAEKDGFNLKLICLGETDNYDLLKEINSDNAKYVFHFECPQTAYRQVLMTSKTENTYIIPDQKIKGKLEVSSFIVATREISSFVSNDFNDDYNGYRFNFDRGQVLAIGDGFTFNIDKDDTDLMHTSSVFSIIKNADNTIKEMIVNYNSNKIIIQIPEDDHQRFGVLNSNLGLSPVLNSLVIIPALQYVLDSMAKQKTYERSEFDEHAWYRAIRKALVENFNCDLESSEFNDINKLSLAQKLIANPLSQALNFLWDGFALSDDEEE